MVGTFIDEVTAAFERSAADGDAANGRTTTEPATSLRDLVVDEAFDLCVAFIDVDDRHADTELWALIETFGPLMPDIHLAGATPATLRNTDMLTNKK